MIQALFTNQADMVLLRGLERNTTRDAICRWLERDVENAVVIEANGQKVAIWRLDDTSERGFVAQVHQDLVDELELDGPDTDVFTAQGAIDEALVLSRTV